MSAGSTSTGSSASLTSPTLTTAPPGDTTSSDTLGDGDGCCEPHNDAGCEEAAVQTCVCKQDPSCCAFEWGPLCVELAQDSCSATCQPDESGTGSTSNVTGVTATDSAGTLGGTFGTFGGTFGTFGGTFGTGGGDVGRCCAAIGGVGCFHAPTETCVCDADPTCCEDEWTEACVTAATDLCGVCNTDDCCDPQGDPGCSDVDVETCVCALDAFCCNMMWDGICIDIAINDCAAACPE